jgi:hypothetical protein
VVVSRAAWRRLGSGEAIRPSKRADSSIGDAGTSTAHAAKDVDAAVVRLNAPGGTLTMADEDLGAAKSLVIHADLVARHDQQQVGKLDGQEQALFTDLHETLNAGSGVLPGSAGRSH